MPQLEYFAKVRCCDDCAVLLHHPGVVITSPRSAAAAAAGSSSSRDTAHYECLFRYLLVGDSGVGKTCINKRFSTDSFTTSYITTIGIGFEVKTVAVGNARVKLQLWDTAGQERFRSITTSYYRGSQCVLVAYDVTSRDSFLSVRSTWLPMIQQHAPAGVTVILVANKADFVSERQVTTAEGQTLADEEKLPFFEVSARDGVNIYELYGSAATAVAQRLSVFDLQQAHAEDEGNDGQFGMPFEAHAAIMPAANPVHARQPGVGVRVLRLIATKTHLKVMDGKRWIALKIADLAAVHVRCAPGGLVALSLQRDAQRSFTVQLRFAANTGHLFETLIRDWWPAHTAVVDSLPIRSFVLPAGGCRADELVRDDDSAGLTAQDLVFVASTRAVGQGAKLPPESDMLIQHLERLPTATPLLQLNLSHLRLADVQVDALAHALLFNTSILHLDLSNSALTAASIDLLLLAIPPHLKQLRLASCNLGVAPVDSLRRLLSLPLELLSLSNNQLARCDNSLLATVKRSGRQPSQLNLAHNGFTDNEAAPLYGLAISFDSLDLTGNPDLTSASMAALHAVLQRRDRLRSHSLLLGFGVSESIVDQLKAAMLSVSRCLCAEVEKAIAEESQIWKDRNVRADTAQRQAALAAIRDTQPERIVEQFRQWPSFQITFAEGGSFECRDWLCPPIHVRPALALPPPAAAASSSSAVGGESLEAYTHFLALFLQPTSPRAQRDVRLDIADKEKIVSHRRRLCVSDEMHARAVAACGWSDDEFVIGVKYAPAADADADSRTAAEAQTDILLRAIGETDARTFPRCMLLLPCDQAKAVQTREGVSNWMRWIARAAAAADPVAILHKKFQLHLLCEFELRDAPAPGSSESPSAASSPSSPPPPRRRCWHRTIHCGYPVHALRKSFQPLAPYVSATLRALRAVGSLASVVKLGVDVDVDAFVDGMERCLGVGAAADPKHLDTLLSAGGAGDDHGSSGAPSSSSSSLSPGVALPQCVSHEALRILESLVHSADQRRAAKGVTESTSRFGDLYKTLCRRAGPHADRGSVLWLCERHQRIVHRFDEQSITAELFAEEATRAVDQ